MNPRSHFEDFESKVRICNPDVRKLAISLDSTIRGFKTGIEYYPHGNDMRYTDSIVPVLPSGRRRPFVHIRPCKTKLVVHIYNEVSDTRNETRPRKANSRFLKKFSIGSLDELDEYRLRLIRESLQAFLKKWAPNY